MKTCPKCRTTYQDDKNFCRSCGVKLISEKIVDPKISARKTVLEDKIKVDPLNPNLLFEYGDFLLKNKEFKDSELVIYRALEIDKSNISTKKLLFKCLHSAGKTDQAAEIGIEILNKTSNDLQLLTEVAQLFITTKKYSIALQYLDQILVIAPDNTEALIMKANILQKSMNYEDALKLWESVYKKDKENLLAQLFIGINEYKKENFIKSKEFISSAISKLGVQSYEYFLGLIYLTLLLLKTEKAENAITENYFDIINFGKPDRISGELRPLVAEIALFLGDSSLNENLFVNAISYFKKSKKLGLEGKGNEGISSTYLKISISNFEKRDNNNALLYVNKALSIVDDNSEIHKKCLSHKQLILNNKTKKLKKTIWISALALILILISISIFILIKFQNEKNTWNVATMENSVESYNNYLKLYPVGKYVIEAISNKEDAEWEIVLSKDNPVIYSNYISSYKNGKYLDEALWKVAKSINNARSFNSYISYSKSMKYIDEAKNELKKCNYNINFVVGKKSNSDIFIESIRITTDETIISLKSNKSGILHGSNHKYGYCIIDKITGKKYKIRNASIDFEKSIPINEIFKLYFERLPESIKYINLLEGNCFNGCWNFYNIVLESAEYENPFIFKTGKQSHNYISIVDIKNSPNYTIVSLKSKKNGGALLAPNDPGAYFIQDDDTGEKYHLLGSSIGFNQSIDKNVVIDLIFEKIKENTKQISLIEGNHSDNLGWHFRKIKIDY